MPASESVATASQEAVEALRADGVKFVDAVCCILLAMAPQKRPVAEFTQHDGQRPAWARTARVFLVEWRKLHSAGDPGVTARGKTRIMTAEAAARVAQRPNQRSRIASVAPVPVNADQAALEDLGLRLVQGGRK
jgi:hypothetical protein